MQPQGFAVGLEPPLGDGLEPPLCDGLEPPLCDGLEPPLCDGLEPPEFKTNHHGVHTEATERE
jgi:hypothetical protein